MFPAFPPLVFEPLYRSYLWGGRRLATKLGKNLPAEGIWAESWEIVDHPQGQSVVASGPWQGLSLGRLIDEYRQDILGSDFPLPTGDHQLPNNLSRFPLLLKYLDCQNVLSVQVHPDDTYGMQMSTPDLGKTEAWYIIDAQPDSVLYAGLKEGVTRESLAQAIRMGRTEDCLHAIRPAAGDCIFIPAGTVHALGAGLLVAEVQQASDCTFRLYDWNRVDATGAARPLHIEQALEVIDFERGPVGQVTPQPFADSSARELVACDKFRLVSLGESSTHLLELPTCKIVAVPQGTAAIATEFGEVHLSAGQSALVPHACREAKVVVASDSVVLVAEPIRATSNPS